jgi:hypothetical protein
MSEDRLVNTLATLISKNLRAIGEASGYDGDSFEEGGNYYLWSLAYDMGVTDAVDQELYHRDGGPE